MSLARITRIAVRFSPWLTDCRSARDFLARITSAQGTNPDCQITTQLRVSGRPSVTVEYSNKRSDTFDTSGLSAPQILARLRSLSDEMDTSDILSKVGVANTKLEVPVEVGAGQHRRV